jgi:predicted DNA-binding protein YlxM (UPF0122 family)
LRDIFRQLGLQYEQYLAEPNEFSKPAIIIYKTKGEGKKAAYTIAEDQLPLFLEHYYKPSEVTEPSENYLGVSELSKKSGITRHVIIQSLNKIKKAWQTYNRTKSVNDQPLISLLTVRSKGRKAGPAIEKRQYALYFETYLQEKSCPLQDDSDLDANEVAKMTGINVDSIRERFNELYHRQQKKQLPTKEAIAPVCTITRKRKDKLIPQLTIRKSDFQSFIDNHFGSFILRTRSEDELTVTDIALRTGLSRDPIHKSMAKILGEWEAYHRDPSNRPKPGVTVSKVRDTNTAKSRTYAIPKDCWEYYFEEYLAVKTGCPKTAEDLTLVDVAKLLELSQKVVFAAFKSMENTWSRYQENPSMFEEMPIKIKIIKTKRKLARSISVHDLGRTIEQYFPQKLAFYLANRNKLFPALVEESSFQMS